MIIYWEKDSDKIRDKIEEIIFHAELVVDRKFDSETMKPKTDNFYKLGCGFDIETSRVELPDITISICYHWQFTIDYLTVGGRSLTTMYQFFSELDKLLQVRNARLLVLDANLNYEFQFCKHYWNGLGISELFAKGAREPLRLLVGKSLFFAEVLGLFGTSLANIADNYCTIKKLKGDLDHNKVRNSKTIIYPKEGQYCENDTVILKQLGGYIFNNFFGNNEKFPLTAISRIRNKIKKKCGKRLRYIKKDIEEWMPDEDDYTILRNYLFKGGICGTNLEYMNIELDNVLMADYTSDYPAKCFHYKFPMGKCRRVKPSVENIKKALKLRKPFIMKIEFHNLQSTTTHSIISTHKCIDSKEFKQCNSTIDNGRIYRADKATLFLNDIELLSFGFFNTSDRTAYTFDRAETKVLQMWVFDYYGKLPEHVLSEIEEEYRKKTVLKKEIKKHETYLEENGKLDISFYDYMNLRIDYRDSKSAVNGIFGMMCTALYRDDLIFNGDIIDNTRDEDNKIIYREYSQAIQNLFLYPFWGFWITSYARMVLIDAIIRYPDVIVQYDTDSIYFVNDGSEQSEGLKKYMLEYNSKVTEVNKAIFNNDPIFEDLGCWDINKENYKRFKGLGSKRYMYEDKKGLHVTISGCRSVNVVTYNGEIYDEMEFYKLANNKKMNDNEIEEVVKTIKRISTLEYQYIKKKVGCSIFEYFDDGLEIEEEFSNKLCSKYVELNTIAEKIPSLKIKVEDYQGNICTMPVSSCVVLEPVEFNMSVKDEHIMLYKLLQSFIKNHPNVSLLDNSDLEETIKNNLAS